MIKKLSPEEMKDWYYQILQHHEAALSNATEYELMQLRSYCNYLIEDAVTLENYLADKEGRRHSYDKSDIINPQTVNSLLPYPVDTSSLSKKEIGLICSALLKSDVFVYKTKSYTEQCKGVCKSLNMLYSDKVRQHKIQNDNELNEFLKSDTMRFIMPQLRVVLFFDSYLEFERKIAALD